MLRIIEDIRTDAHKPKKGFDKMKESQQIIRNQKNNLNRCLIN